MIINRQVKIQNTKHIKHMQLHESMYMQSSGMTVSQSYWMRGDA